MFIIKLYTTGCPKCEVLKAKLKQKNIPFDEINNMQPLLERGFMTVPVLEVDDKFMDFSEAIKYVNAM